MKYAVTLIITVGWGGEGGWGGTESLNESLTNNFIHLPYFFSYKTEFFSFQNNPKNLDPSHKMDLDLWDCFRKGKGKTRIKATFRITDLHCRYF